MATQTEKSTMKYYDKHGIEHKVYPKTTVDQVIGLEDTISDLVEASDVTDTYGIAGTAGAKKKPQNMFDAIGNFIQNSAITVSNFVNKFKERLQNNLTTTEEGYALDARQGKELQTNINNVSTTVTDMGTTISSMQTSIEALEESAEHMIAAKIVLDKDEWSNNSQTITVEGMQEEDNMCIFICPFASSTEAFVSNNVICNIQDIDTLGFKCDTVPDVDIEVYLILKSATTEEDLSNLEIALTEAYQVIQRINSASSTAETNITTLNTSNNTATTNIASLQSQNQTAASRLSSLESANSTASTTIASLESQNQTATNNISTLETASATATQNLSDLETANATASNNLSSLGTANTTATSNISSLDTQNTNATSNITTLTSLNGSTQTMVDDLNLAKADANNVLADLQNENAEADTNLADLTTANDTAISVLNQINSDSGNADSIIDSLTTATSSANTALNSLDTSIDTANTTKTALDTSIDTASAQNTLAQTNITNLTSINSTASDTYDDLYDLNQTASQNASTISGAITNANTAASNAQSVADTVQAKLDNGDFVGQKGERGDSGMTAIHITLLSADWVNKQQTKTISGIIAENQQAVFICPYASSTAEYVDNNVICTSQTTDTLVFSCDVVPTSDLDIYVIIKDTSTVEDLTNLNLAISEANQVIQTIQTQNSSASTNISSLQTQNASASTNIASLTSLNQTAATRIDDLTTANGTATTTLDGLTSANNTASTNITTLEDQLDSASANISALSTANTTATNNISDLGTGNSTATSNISSLSSANSTATTNITTLTGINNTASQNITDINTATADGQTVLGNLSSMNATASQTLSDLSTENDEAIANLNALDYDARLTALEGNSSVLSGVYMDRIYGISEETAIDIDSLYSSETSKGYIYRVQVGDYFSGTSPTTTLGGGNAFLLIGFSGGNDDYMTFGCQMAFNFASNKIARRYASFVASGATWSDWQPIENANNVMTKYANPTLTETQLLTLAPGMYMYGTAYSWLPTGCNGYGTIVSYLTNSSGYGVIQIFDTNGNVYSRHHNATSWHTGWQTLYKTPIHCVAQVTTGGDTTYTGAIVFNNVLQNYGNCYNTSTGVFTCPVNGIYAMSFGYYSNNTAATARPAIMVNGSMVSMKNGPYGHDLSITRYCNAGDQITAGAYSSSFPVYLYAGGGHNHFSVTLLQQIP